MNCRHISRLILSRISHRCQVSQLCAVHTGVVCVIAVSCVPCVVRKPSTVGKAVPVLRLFREPRPCPCWLSDRTELQNTNQKCLVHQMDYLQIMEMLIYPTIYHRTLVRIKYDFARLDKTKTRVETNKTLHYSRTIPWWIELNLNWIHIFILTKVDAKKKQYMSQNNVCHKWDVVTKSMLGEITDKNLL